MKWLDASKKSKSFVGKERDLNYNLSRDFCLLLFLNYHYTHFTDSNNFILQDKEAEKKFGFCMKRFVRAMY